MNFKPVTLFIIIATFLAGAFISVLDPMQVDWSWYTPVLVLGVLALFVYRKAHHSEAKASHRLSGNLQVLEDSLANILGNLETINADSANLPVSEARFEIDRLLREDLSNFANARERVSGFIPSLAATKVLS